MKTAAGLIEHCKTAVNEKWKYVYGAKMQRLTLAQIQALRREYGSLVWAADDAKAGHICCDCSGLISSYTGIERSSTNYKDTALCSIKISEIRKNWSAYVGWGLWLPGHIGVVADKEGYYYAMDGSARNAVCNPLNMQLWLCAIKLKDIDYTPQKKEDDEMVETINANVNGKEIKANAIVKDGKTYIELRSLENAGFTVGYMNDGTKMRVLDNDVNELPITVNGDETKVKAVNLHGFNFVQIRDLADVLGIKVEFEDGKVILL
jgi:hypothetical protein